MPLEQVPGEGETSLTQLLMFGSQLCVQRRHNRLCVNGKRFAQYFTDQTETAVCMIICWYDNKSLFFVTPRMEVVSKSLVVVAAAAICTIHLTLAVFREVLTALAVFRCLTSFRTGALKEMEDNFCNVITVCTRMQHWHLV